MPDAKGQQASEAVTNTQQAPSNDTAKVKRGPMQSRKYWLHPYVGSMSYYNLMACLTVVVQDIKEIHYGKI